MDACGDIIQGLADLAVTIVEAVVRLLLLLIEIGVRLVNWILSPLLSEKQRHPKLSERFRLVFRRVVHVLLILGAAYALVYLIWLREPTPQPPPSPPSIPASKIEQARKVIEKAKQIKERLLSPKTEP